MLLDATPCRCAPTQPPCISEGCWFSAPSIIERLAQPGGVGRSLQAYSRPTPTQAGAAMSSVCQVAASSRAAPGSARSMQCSRQSGAMQFLRQSRAMHFSPSSAKLSQMCPAIRKTVTNVSLWIRWCSLGVGQSPFEFQKGVSAAWPIGKPSSPPLSSRQVSRPQHRGAAQPRAVPRPAPSAAHPALRSRPP
jgi:hypothetical protein